jgi:hypothetical protein
MTQHYSDPSRETEPHALPDIEVFYLNQNDIDQDYRDSDTNETDMSPGWYWWTCFPGCLPDSEPIGPFNSHKEALAAAQEDCAQ